jgi:hypothetical protein
MKNNKKILGIVAVVLLIVLIVTNTLLFRLYITDMKESQTKLQTYSYWFCMEGNYNTMLYYNNRYDIPIDKSVHDKLAIICYDMIYNNINYSVVNTFLLENSSYNLSFQ